MDWFAQRNVSLKIENDNRIFPESNSSQTIIDCFLNEVQAKNFKIKTIPNDYFVDIKNETTDNGQELKGYYDKNQLKKIIHFVGLSAWNIVTEYYYKDNQLIFVLNSKYQSVSENGFLEKPKLLYRNRYYFKNNKLIKKIEEETSETFDFIKLSNELKKDLKKTGNREFFRILWYNTKGQ